MNAHRYQNWIHLDLKGMIPAETKFLEWLDWFAERKFSHIVLEYEDRFPWKTFHETWRPGFDAESWQRIWMHCSSIGLTVVPLIQTFGHLEWLLKHEKWKHLRCADHINLLCPENPEVKSLLRRWIEEVAGLHPQSPYIHVGLDEVYHMGECSFCRKRGGTSSILLNHAQFVCETVHAAGKRPVLWADMFLHHDAVPPHHSILCDWKYKQFDGINISKIRNWNCRTIMAASAIRCAFPSYAFLCDHLQARFDNIRQWHQLAGEHVITAIIHTTWGRSRGLAPLYGPWAGWLPAFEVAVNPDITLSPCIQTGLEIFHRGISSGIHAVIEQTVGELHALHSEYSLEEAALRWWELSLRYHAEVYVLLYHTLGRQEIQRTSRFQGVDPDLFTVTAQVRTLLCQNLSILEKDIRAYLEKHQWSDIDEYLDGHIETIRHVAKI